ncbi:hypothetical protein GBP13_00810 [Pediococcus acidilactici]|uniref:hypothetical protein n=1 Tax=Pediococcus acidilactici TaxID=1254 RepID=UPI000B35F93B|nr:hypothetical protein [Pediococcus acidilactici]KAF0365235.1 hypothetical protein GBO50_00810 [Pediococcus acidilactici]KAF0369313.1 hypothetical protein GBO55_00810 [Pediococcus acidilactici]KAF0419445.1 hypothetical protein GBO80_02045 [Pediococcus acidilactici]KAF0423999.1 hypothetical protein GBO82_04100 [Pediococcus acidilactici]KAF0474975.1 hypothetical protein GBP08_00810 [Pediococcus acidilactici]
MSSKKSDVEDIKKEISEKASFIFQLKQTYKSHILNWTLYVSVFFTILLFFSISKFGQQQAFNSRVVDVSKGMFSISVSALGIILAAVAVTIVLYSRRNLHKMVFEKEIMAGLLFPYRYVSLLWTIVGLLSFFASLVQFNIALSLCVFLNCIYCFLIVYAVTYFLYVISEIVQHVITAAFVEDKD